MCTNCISWHVSVAHIRSSLLLSQHVLFWVSSSQPLPLQNALNNKSSATDLSTMKEESQTTEYPEPMHSSGPAMPV